MTLTEAHDRSLRKCSGCGRRRPKDGFRNGFCSLICQQITHIQRSGAKTGKEVLARLFARTEYMTGVQTCRKCGQTKPLEDYTPCRKSLGGVLKSCRACEQAAKNIRSKSERGRQAERVKRQRPSHKLRHEMLSLQRRCGPIEKVTNYKEWAYAKSLIWAAFDNRCCYCGADQNLTVEHLIPVASGGGNMLSNLAPACEFDNFSKGSKSLDEFAGEAKAASIRHRLAKALEPLIGVSVASPPVFDVNLFDNAPVTSRSYIAPWALRCDACVSAGCRFCGALVDPGVGRFCDKVCVDLSRWAKTYGVGSEKFSEKILEKISEENGPLAKIKCRRCLLIKDNVEFRSWAPKNTCADCVRACKREWNKSEAGRRCGRNYKTSEAGRASRARYAMSALGQEARARARMKERTGG